MPVSLAVNTRLTVALWSCLYILLSSAIPNVEGSSTSLTWAFFPFSVLSHNNTTQQATPKHWWHITICIHSASEPELFHGSEWFSYLSGAWLALGCPGVASAGPTGTTQLRSTCLSASSRLVLHVLITITMIQEQSSPITQCLSSISSVPLAKTSHKAKLRTQGLTNRLHLLMGEAAKAHGKHVNRLTNWLNTNTMDPPLMGVPGLQLFCSLPHLPISTYFKNRFQSPLINKNRLERNNKNVEYTILICTI